MRILMRTAPLCVFFLAFTSYVSAQCADKAGFAKQACEVQAGNIPSASTVLSSLSETTKSEVLTTSYADSIHAQLLLPSMDPKEFAPLAKLNRTDDGSFIIVPGAYEAYVEGYSLDKGAQGRGSVGAYFPAPFIGPRAKVIQSALKQAELHPELKQAELQALISATIAGTDLENMPAPVQQTAVSVLPPDMIAQLHAAPKNTIPKAGIGILNRHWSNSPLAQKLGLPPSIQNSNVLKDARDVMGPPSASAPAITPVARGSWVLMPGGFYIRYLLDVSSKVHLQVMMLPADKATQAVFDPTAYVVVLGATPSQRLGVTMRSVK